MGAIPTPRTPTREDWCALVEAEWDDGCAEFIELVLFHVRHNSGLKEMILARIRAGEKFGPLNLKSINFPVDIVEEIGDGIAYVFGERLHELTKSR